VFVGLHGGYALEILVRSCRNSSVDGKQGARTVGRLVNYRLMGPPLRASGGNWMSIRAGSATGSTVLWLAGCEAVCRPTKHVQVSVDSDGSLLMSLASGETKKDIAVQPDRQEFRI